MKKSHPRIYLELVVIGFCSLMGIGLSKAFLPIMALGFDSTGISVGLVTSAYFVARFFFDLPSGVVAIKIGRRNLLVVASLVSLVGCLECAFSFNVYMLTLGMAIWGCGAALFLTCSTSLLFDVFKQRERGKAVGAFHAMEFTGSFWVHLSAPHWLCQQVTTAFSLSQVLFFSLHY